MRPPRTDAPRTASPRTISARVAFLVDLVAVVAFVVVGRRSHDEGGALAGTVKVAAPFVIALVAAWLVALRIHATARLGSPTTARFGAVIWVITVAGGMILRHTGFHRSTAATFVIVAAVFLAVTLIGWRWFTSRRLTKARAARLP